MDASALLWLSEMELDNSVFTNQSDFMDSFDEELASLLRTDFDNSHSSPSSTVINLPNPITNPFKSPEMGSEHFEPPAKLQKPNNYSLAQNLPNHDSPVSSTPIILSFGNQSTQENLQNANARPLNPHEEAAVSEVLKSQVSPVNPDQKQLKCAAKVKKPSRVRPPSQTYDHIIAERKRREQLSQRFVALSTIVPGLKKMDKTSVLGDAIKYLKHLQERVKTLEEQAKKQTMESVVLVKKSQLMIAHQDNMGSSDEDESRSSDEQPLPEIEARVCNNHFLLRVHCEKQKGVFVHLLSEVEKLNLCVVNTIVTPFGNFVIDITIIAEIENEFNLTAKEVVRRLSASLRRNKNFRSDES